MDMMIRIIGVTCFVVSVVLIVGALFRKNSNKTSVRGIICEYFKKMTGTVWNASTLIVAPLFFAIGLSILFDPYFELCDNIIVVLSILVSMEFAIMSTLASKDYSKVENPKKKEKIEKAVEETNLTIVFCVLISILDMLLCLIACVLKDCSCTVVQSLIWGGIVFFFISLLLNTMIIIKRLSVLVNSKPE